MTVACKGHHSFMTLSRRLLCLVALASALGGPAAPAVAQNASSVVKQAAIQAVTVGVGMSVPVELPEDAQDVIIADPKTANAIVRSTRQAFIIGVETGQTNIFFLGADGRQILGLAVNVGRDMTFLRSTIKQMIPDADITLETTRNSVIVRGSVASAEDAARIMDVVQVTLYNPATFNNQGPRVVNAMSIRGKDQVHLKVTVAEIQRTAVKQLGINLNALSTDASAVTSALTGSGMTNASGFLFGALTANTFNANGTAPSSGFAAGYQSGSNVYAATVRLLEEQGLMRTLAEPTLTAISGEQARFLAGGEFPIPASRDRDGNLTFMYKTFGVGLAFTPVVLTEGRISLRVGTEVSEISTEVSYNLNGLNVPGLKTRRADTTIELPSGGSMVIAGLLQERTRQVVSGQPGLMNLPILGALFRSRDYQSGQTEIVIIVTPYLVKPVSANKLKRPDDNFRPATDKGGYLLGQLNSISTTTDGTSGGNGLRGPVGFNRD